MEARHTIATLRDGLVRCGFLPPDGGPIPFTRSDNILPTMRDAWESTPLRTRQRSTMLAWCECGLSQDAVLGYIYEPLEPLAVRLVWWPCGRPIANTVGVLSSRISHDDAARTEWLSRLRTVLSVELAEDETLISVQGTTCDPWVRHWSSRSLRPLQFIQIAKGRDLVVWRRHTVRQPYSRGEPNRFLGFASPSMYLAEHVPKETITNDRSYKIPPADWILSQFAGKLIVLTKRSQGGIDHLVKLLSGEQKQRPAEAGLPHLTTLVDCSSKQSNPLKSTAYAPQSPFDRVVPTSNRNPVDCNPVDWGPGVPATKVLASRELLLHCTRGVSLQPESIRRLMDEWFIGQETHEYGAIGTLKRILLDRVLLAQSHSIRGGSAVVCFSDHSLNDLPQLRKYQRHRRRWDFEPFGVAIRRDALVRLGARPVRYGNNDTWDSLADSDRPFFQASTDKGAKHNWTREAEWRVVGDVHLDKLPPEAIHVFVESRLDLNAIASLSRWSVVCIEDQTIYLHRR